MGRKPKCTVEEKISAVEDYLNGIRSVSEIMVDLSIKSTRTIRDWILAYQNGGIKASALLQLTIPIPVNLKLKWFGSISTGKDRLPIYAPDMEFLHMQHYSCIVFHTHQAKDIHNDYESLLYYKMSLCTQKQGGMHVIIKYFKAVQPFSF